MKINPETWNPSNNISRAEVERIRSLQCRLSFFSASWEDEKPKLCSALSSTGRRKSKLRSVLGNFTLSLRRDFGPRGVAKSPGNERILYAFLWDQLGNKLGERRTRTCTALVVRCIAHNWAGFCFLFFENRGCDVSPSCVFTVCDSGVPYFLRISWMQDESLGSSGLLLHSWPALALQPRWRK